METIVHAALEEICSQGINGLSLSLLFPRLLPSLYSTGLPLCPAVKRAVWSGLVAVPGLQLQARGSDFDPKSKSLEECEGLDLKICADEQLRRCFVGLYDVKASSITPPQQRVLERLALARANGVTQVQLCKELGIAPNNFHYVAKRLESWGLVVRQLTIVRTKEASTDKESKNSSLVNTNLIRLCRYALPLGSQQRLEITKENKNLDESFGEDVAGGDSNLDEYGHDDVLVKDFLPALKAICDRLEQAEGKVLVVLDIKRELGYQGKRGHKTWKNICNRLKQAGLVEVFNANVDNKVAATTNSKRSNSRGQNKPVSCLRLLKKFSPKLFEQRALGCEFESGNRSQNTDQLVELPLEQQIFDMINTEGSKGLRGIEVCRRLGISNRMFDNLINTMVPRFRLHQLSENYNRGSAYRFWTQGNFNPELPNSSFNRSDDGPDERRLALLPVEEPSYCESSKRTDSGPLTLKRKITGENTASGDAEQERKDGSQDRGSCDMAVRSKDVQDLTHDMSITVHVSSSAAETNSNLMEYSSHTVPKPLNLQQGQRYPSITSAQRELRILERLKTEKIILRPELQRWLESFEKDKHTRMDRKTLQRCLKKLEQEGHCKLIDFSIPGVTNCGRHRDAVVVVHPSFEGSAGELSDQVHDRWRLFDTQIRGAVCQPKNELPVPVLRGIERLQNNASTDAQSVKSEAMRANGFVLAKMVRTKLLHHFLWGYVTNLANDEASSWSKHITSRNPHSSCLLFGLDAAIKAMPLELFLQVVGTALKLKDMIEKCKNGLLLSDLPDEEYKCLMDTRATGRLSWLIDILRRLKLIRMVADESPRDAVKNSHATLLYALELKPYIEEPPSVSPLPGGSCSNDLRPHLRHDFVLSTCEALDKYWQTLEYCYAAADPKAALLAFPGSVVHEVCLYRSWTTVRVMTAEQRAKLFKRIKEHPSKKLTFKECREIAKDLELTLEQVLRVYYDNRQQRLNRFQGDLGVQNPDSDGHSQSRRKRKISSEGRSAKQAKINHAADSHEDKQPENVEEPGVAEQQEHHEPLIDQCIMPKFKQTRQPKFSWTDEADRQLIIQYARQRAMQGAKRGTDWASIGDLPAPPTTCRRRVAVLNMDIKFRKSIMRLCNLLTQRYAQQLDLERNLVNRSDCGQESDSHGERWDDFDNSKIKTALNEVLMYKQMIKLDTAKRTGSAFEGTHNLISNSPSKFEKDGDNQQIDSSRRSRINRLPQKFVKHLKEGVSFTRLVNQSLAVSNAVELFKLVFLSTSKATEMPSLLAETLRCYSEHDLHSAFDYLRQKKIMIGSGTCQPFVLSQHFLRSLSMSQFPANTGKRAAKLASWTREKGKELMEGTVNLPSDLQCGDIYHLFALVSSGELSIFPLLPDEGVGEAEDSRSSKRKSDDHEFEDYGLSKKPKLHYSQESEIFSRREKGFPGLNVSVSRASISRSNVVDFFKDENRTLLFSENDSFYSTLGQKVSGILSSIDHVKESPDFSNIVPATVIYGDSLWEIMTNYTIQHLLKHCEEECTQVHRELIKTAYKTIQKAGDQGLSMSMISESTGMQGTMLAEHVIDVLQLFGLVLKVNSYDSVHVVDGLYRTKYFLTSKATRCQDLERAPSSTPQTVDNETITVEGVDNCELKVDRNRDEVHKVTILNLSEDCSQHSNVLQPGNKLESFSQSERMSNVERRENQNLDVSASTFQPILPWINGDGTINGIVYRGLTRRILGIVIQNPGILEDNILGRMEVLNPQSCRRLLELMVLDKHLLVRKMTQSTSSGTPALLEGLIGGHFKKPKFIRREHYFANPMSTTIL